MHVIEEEEEGGGETLWKKYSDIGRMGGGRSGDGRGMRMRGIVVRRWIECDGLSTGRRRKCFFIENLFIGSSVRF